MKPSSSSSPSSTATSSPATAVVDVAILGAGMAGLRALQVLREQQNPHSVLVIEGRDTAGGRIRWTTLPGSSNSGTDELLYIDEGAQFIHGLSPRNPILKLAKRRKIPFYKMDWDDTYSFVGPNQQELPEKVERKEERVVEKIQKKLEQWQNAQWHQERRAAGPAKSSSDVSLHSVLEKYLQEHVAKDSSLSVHRLWARLRMEIQDDYAVDLEHLSALHFDQDDVFSYTDGVPFTYQQLVQAMLPPDHKSSIRYQHKIEQITFPTDSSSEGLVQITCRRTDTEQRVEIWARHVICTLPLGVLKQQITTDFFVPALPLSLQESIQRLGYGCLEKVWLSFHGPPFWPTDADGFDQQATTTPFMSWFLPARVYDNPAYTNTLCCFVSGTAARALANVESKHQVAAQALDALREILNVPAGDNLLKNVHVTQWSTDPWSGHGSYSHVALGSTGDDYRIWEKAFFHNRLWFAGEATSAKYPGTVHGAYLTGERAARACYQTLSSTSR